jgi:2'-5' RNA ligase
MREEILEWGKQALADPVLRPTPAGSLHVTLAFLGHRPEEEVEPISEVVRRCGAPAPWIELLDPVQRPARGRPRLFALPVLSPGTEALQAGLRQGLVEGGFYEPQERPFWPHVTVAVAAPPGEIPEELAEPRIAVRMTLYRSELQPTGARYVPLAQVKLPGAGGSEVN